LNAELRSPYPEDPPLPLTRRRFLASAAALAAGCAGTRGASVSPPRLAAPTACEIGENPLWHPDERIVFFLDIARGIVHAHDPVAGSHREFSRGPVTGGMLLQEDGRLVLLQDGRISILGFDGGQREVRKGLSPEGVRFNDGIADPEGRIYTGELGGKGRMMRFDRDGRMTVLGEGYGVPNGWGFTPDLRQVYFTDSIPRLLYRFDYDRATGDLSNRRVFAEIPQAEGVPDGMAVDAEGHVWTAVWFGARLKRYAPDGRLEREVRFPVRQTSAVCFGGPDLSDLYVTSSATDAADSLKPPGYDVTAAPRGGGLYALRAEGLRGAPLFRSRVAF